MTAKTSKPPTAWDIATLVKCLSCHQEGLCSIPSTHKPRMVAHTYSSNTQEDDTGRLELQHHLWLQRKFQKDWDTRVPVSKNKINKSMYLYAHGQISTFLLLIMTFVFSSFWYCYGYLANKEIIFYHQD